MRFHSETMNILTGDCLSLLPTLDAQSVQCVVTSPPYYGLRDYGVDGQIGLEQTPAEYIGKLVAVFREVWRVLKDDGTLWLNLGDSYTTGGSGQNFSAEHGSTANSTTTIGGYGHRRQNPVAGMPTKNLVGVPWRVALALQADGWYLRSDIIWNKPNPMPESVTDRPTKAHEYIFLMAKQERYYYDAAAIEEKAIMASGKSGFGGPKNNNGKLAHTNEFGKSWEKREQRNRRSVWTVPTHSYSGAHFATFPPKLIEPCILAGSREGDTVLDPFTGAGTTGLVSIQHHRKFVGIELNPAYVELAKARLANVQQTLFPARA